MSTLEDFDKSIKAADLEFNIAAYQSQIHQKRKRILEAQKLIQIEKTALAEIDARLKLAQEQLEAL